MIGCMFGVHKRGLGGYFEVRVTPAGQSRACAVGWSWKPTSGYGYYFTTWKNSSSKKEVMTTARSPVWLPYSLWNAHMTRQDIFCPVICELHNGPLLMVMWVARVIGFFPYKQGFFSKLNNDIRTPRPISKVGFLASTYCTPLHVTVYCFRKIVYLFRLRYFAYLCDEK